VEYLFQCVGYNDRIIKWSQVVNIFYERDIESNTVIEQGCVCDENVIVCQDE
jgi:hypothetical protein